MLYNFCGDFGYWLFFPRFELPNQYVSPSFTIMKHFNEAINNHIRYGGCPLLPLYTRDAMRGNFLGFKCFSGVLNFLNSENSLLSRILFGLFPLMLCLLCEPICPVLIPAGILQRSLISCVRKYIVSVTIKQGGTV
jgi:hypothetical protein